MCSARVRDSESSRARPGVVARRRRRSPAGRGTRALTVAMGVAGVVAVTCCWAGAAQLRGRAPAWAGAWLDQAVGGMTGLPTSWNGRPQIVSAGVGDSPRSSYRNPLRGVLPQIVAVPHNQPPLAGVMESGIASNTRALLGSFTWPAIFNSPPSVSDQLTAAYQPNVVAPGAYDPVMGSGMM